MSYPLMRKATAVWLVDNTTLTFTQIAEFCGLHELEVNGIADGEVAQGVKGFDPITNNQLTQEEIDRCQSSKKARLKLKYNPAAEGETKRKGPRYTPLSKRTERPAAIAWLVKFHPELSDGQISKLVGTTKPTIQSIRDRSHWNFANISPVDPVALGMCKQVELDSAVAKASKRRDAQTPVPTPSDLGIMDTADSLAATQEPRMPSNMSGLENFSLNDDAGEDKADESTLVDAESLFNLPESDDDPQPG